MKLRRGRGNVVLYGTPLDIGNWSGGNYLDGGKSVEDTCQTE
jgi:hypothetical protein